MMNVFLRIGLCLVVGLAGFLGMRGFFWAFYRNSEISGIHISLCLGAALAVLAFAVMAQYILPESISLYVSIASYVVASLLSLYGMGRIAGLAMKR